MNDEAREKIAQREAEIHSKYYNKKYGWHPWDKLPPLMKAEIYDNADMWIKTFKELGYKKPEGEPPLIRFSCLYDGIHYEKCPNNDNGICRTKYIFVPENLRHPFDGKNEIKCPCG